MADAPFVFLPLGAIIQSINVGGINIVQGFPSAAEYQSHNSPYFGETIGRVANRIAGAKINSINGGKSYPLAANNGTNNLHGGNVGWGKKIWNGPKPVGIRPIPGLDGLEGGESVEFTLRSEDGEEGFPGTLDVKVIYTTATQKVNGKTAYVLGIEYEAELVDGADETVINMTNHSYFNLSGEPTIEGTTIELVTDQHLPLDEAGIPLRGPEAPFPGTKVNAPFTLTATEPNIDDCFVVNVKSETVPIDTRSEPLTRLAAASHPKTNIHLEVYSTEPAFQFYTGKHIDVPAVAGVPARINRSGFCVEPGRYVNAINVPEWKNQALLKKGEKYGCRTVYRVWQE